MISSNANMLESKLATTPMTSHPPLLLNHDTTPLSNPTTYRAIVGAKPVQRVGSSMGPLIQPFILRVVYGEGMM